MKRISLKFLLMFAVIASLLAFMPNMAQKSYAASAGEISQWVINENTGEAYVSDVQGGAGLVEGYSEYVLGTKANLLAKANSGFKFYAWRIDGVLKTESFTTTVNEIQTEFEITNNGSSGALNIYPIPKDLKIQAVFKSEYYNFELEDKILASLKYETATLDVNGTPVVVNYESVAGTNPAIYTNAIIGSSIYPTLKYDGTNLYTEHKKFDASEDNVKVDYTLGAFRLNDVVTFKLNLKIEADELNSANVDIKGFKVSSGSGYAYAERELSKSTLLYNNTYILEADELKRSTSFEIYTKINSAKDHKLSWVADALYVVDIIPMIDGTAVEILENDTQEVKEFKQSEIDFVLKNISVNERGYYSKVSNSRYLVKNSSKQGNYVFRLTCNKTISNTIYADQNDKVGETYEYYTFDTMEGKQDEQQTFDPDYNLPIHINYKSRKYQITFKYELFENGLTSTILDGNFAMEGISEIENGLSRGKSVEIKEENLKNSTGYSLFGFYVNNSKDITQDDKNNALNLVMDLNKPSNTVVCVVMEKIKYQINITAVDNITLNKNNSPIYPLSVLTMQNNSANEIVYGETIYKEAQKTLNNNIKIGDVFTLKFVNNNGFKIGVSTKVNQKPQNMVSNFVELNYSVDESFIETYVEEVESATDTLHVINVYLFADYESYTFTYKIDKRSDGANNSVIMANIFATKTDKITDETETVTETKTDENGAKYITFEGLKLYDVVTLYATPLEYQETYYLFDRFTPNGVTRLSVTSTPDVIYPEIITYSHEHIISANETVAVIFAPPKVQLTVGITDETIYSLENVNIYQTLLDDETGEEAEKKLELIDGAYNVQAGEVRVELTNLDTVKYGYYYKECLVSFIGASEQDVETLNGESFVFTLTNSVPYEIEIVCPEVVFEVYIKQHGQEILTDGEYVQFGENNYTELTISNSILSFDLPGNGGIYVADARFGGKILESFAQDDDATTLIYEKTLTEDDFKLFYDVANIDRMIITLDFNYEITKYDIVINLVNNSVKLNGYQDLTEQVNLTITSDYTKEIEVNKITFKNIPYNSSNITITADVPSSTGLIAEYWKNSSIGIFSQTTYSITFQPITATGEVDYFLTYIQYTVKLEYNQAQGAPQVNDNLKANISVGDVISIKTNAFGTSGYQFKNLYQMYVYNANSWEKVKSSVYYKDGQELIKNNNPEYDNTKTYYVLMQTLDYEKTSYLDESFVPSNYYINGAEIKILVVYDYIKIIISNESKMSAKGVNIKHPDTQQEIPVSSFASYSMFVEDELINSDSVFTVADGMLKIIVNMNNISCNINEQVVDINLSKGVNLDNVKAYGLDFKWTPELSGESYTLFIDVSLLLSKMVDANLISYEDEYSVLKLEYSYSISKIKVQMTTNIPTSPYQPSSFYTDQDASSNRLFTMESVSGFMSETNSKDTGYLTENQKFLSKTNFKYTFINPFTQYFKISTYKVYYTPNENSALTDANLIMPEDYAKHGICELKSGDNFTLDVRYVSRITIMLIVETKINFSSSWEGNEITKPVKYNSETGVIENQKLNIGYNSETDDIFMAQFIYEQAKVEQNVKYYDIVSGELKLNGPSTVGKYSVIITFTGEGNYAWLSQITMPYNIYFNISPLDLIVDNSATIETYEKTYNQTSAVELKNVVGNLILSGVSSSGEIFVISMAESNKFKLICTSAYTCDTEGIAVINASDELYRVKVEGLELDTNIDFLKNFKLDKKEIIMPVCVKVNKEAITLSNLEFYDKVYDGTTSVELIDKSFVKLLGVKAGDEVSIDFDKLKMEFEDAEIGANKNVLINTDECLDGFHAVNYYITLSTVVQKPSIFPYKLTKDVEGFGKIELINEKGLTDKTQVSLIPIGAQLQVDVIKDGTPEYVAIYSYISRFLTGNRVFAVGYKLSLNINGEKRAPSNQLYLSVPSTNKLMGVVSLSGEESLELRYSEEESRVLVDLSQIKTNVSHIILTKQRILLELWQIILVVSIAVVVVGGIAITIIVIRKKKLKKYSINEKI